MWDRRRSSRLSGVSRVWLWVSYQRFGLVLLGLAAAPAVLVAALVPRVWWLWVVAVVAGVPLLRWAADVFRQWPRKLRATEFCAGRIARGTFRPESVRGYAGDVCWRVVAREVLRRAGHSRAERARMVAELARRRGRAP